MAGAKLEEIDPELADQTRFVIQAACLFMKPGWSSMQSSTRLPLYQKLTAQLRHCKTDYQLVDQAAELKVQ